MSFLSILKIITIVLVAGFAAFEREAIICSGISRDALDGLMFECGPPNPGNHSSNSIQTGELPNEKEEPKDIKAAKAL